jgi:hypothetical protein
MRTLSGASWGLEQSRRPRIARVSAGCAVVLTASVLLVSHASAADLVGTVRQGGQVVGGRTITLTPTGRPPSSSDKRATTDASGRYIIPGVVPGKYDIRCPGAQQPRPVTIDYGINQYNCNS